MKGEIMRRLLLAAVAVTLGFVGSAQAVCDHRTTTCFTNVDVSGTLSAGSVDCGTTGTFTTATVTALTVSTTTVKGTQGLRFQGYIAASGTPLAADIIGIDSSHILYISTGTGAGAWVKVGGQ
jgi:hypothetical protein